MIFIGLVGPIVSRHSINFIYLTHCSLVAGWTGSAVVLIGACSAEGISRLECKVGLGLTSLKTEKE